MSDPALHVLEPEGSRRAKRREALLQAALAVIRRDGPTASMDAMAAEAGITKPILYRHFGDRDGLLAAVADRFADGLVARLTEALSSSVDPRAQVTAAVESYVGFIEADPALYGFLTQQAPASSPVLLGVVDRVAAALRPPMDAALGPLGIDPAAVETWAYGIVGMVHLSGSRWAAHPTVRRERLIADLVALVADGILGAPSSLDAGE
jgi:AcrR family transcriptional regulator